MDLDIEVTDAPSREARRAIILGLIGFNHAQAGETERQPLAVVVRRGGEVVGGLVGQTSWDWLFIELLWVADGWRGHGLGREIMRRAEAEAAQRACIGAWLDTFEFQARGFYEKLGFKWIRNWLPYRLSGEALEKLAAAGVSPANG